MKTFKLNAIQISEILHSVTARIPRPDGSLVDLWCDLSDTQKEHAAEAVKKIYAAESHTAEELHNLWMQPLLDKGWTQGEYSWENKQHPCLVHFNELPDSEILKDIIWQKMTEAFRDFYTEDDDASELC